MSKLPYIPDKKLYAAVIGACSYVRATGWFNKATDYYANKYSVDVDEVRKYVRIAQGNGQKKANRKNPKRKYYWFSVEYSYENERTSIPCFVAEHARYSVIKALNEDNVKYRLSENDDYSEYGCQSYFGRIEKFNSEKEAIEQCRQWKKELEQKQKESNMQRGRYQSELVSPDDPWRLGSIVKKIHELGLDNIPYDSPDNPWRLRNLVNLIGVEESNE